MIKDARRECEWLLPSADGEAAAIGLSLLPTLLRLADEDAAAGVDVWGSRRALPCREISEGGAEPWPLEVKELERLKVLDPPRPKDLDGGRPRCVALLG